MFQSWCGGIESQKQQRAFITLKDKVESLGMSVINHPEWEYLITDTTEKYLFFGIRHDGTVDWSKGIPGPIRDELEGLKKRIAAVEKS